MFFNNEYILSIDKFNDKYIENKKELSDILFDEYLLNSEYIDKENKIKVFINDENDFIKLKNMIDKYSIDKKYFEEIKKQNNNESIKNINYNKMNSTRFNKENRLHSSIRERMNERLKSRLKERENAKRKSKALDERAERLAARKKILERRKRIAESLKNRINKRIKLVESENKKMRFRNRLNESEKNSFIDRVERRRIINEALKIKEERERREKLHENLIRRHRINESIKNRLANIRKKRLNEAEEEKCLATYKGRKIENMSKMEKRSAAATLKKEIKEIEKMIKERTSKGLSTKALEKKLEKMQYLLDCLTKKEEIKESVRSRFLKNRKMFEAVDEEDEDEKDDDSEEETDDVDDVDDETSDTEDEYEDVDIKAISLKVLKKNVEKVKDALIEKGVDEDDIDVDDDDAEDEDEVEIKIDVNSLNALKDYCESVGIDLEEELGGEIITDDDTEEEKDTDVDTEEDDDSEEDNFTDSEIDDIFK